MNTEANDRASVKRDVRLRTCGECHHAEWTRTQTGRIKKLTPGRCGKANELLEFYSYRKVAPCVTLNRPHLTAIWPDYDAANCPMWSNAKLTCPHDAAEQNQ